MFSRGISFVQSFNVWLFSLKQTSRLETTAKKVFLAKSLEERLCCMICWWIEGQCKHVLTSNSVCRLIWMGKISNVTPVFTVKCSVCCSIVRNWTLFLKESFFCQSVGIWIFHRDAMTWILVGEHYSQWTLSSLSGSHGNSWHFLSCFDGQSIWNFSRDLLGDTSLKNCVAEENF